nr:cyclodeaminase/cyclohydrolase family protein [bacterium]
DAFGMPKKTDEQKRARKAAIEEATKEATLEPLGTLRRALPCLDIAHAAAERGNQNSLSDAGVAGLMARAAAHGAYYNVLINLSGISDEKWTERIREEANALIGKVNEKALEIEALLLSKLRA